MIVRRLRSCRQAALLLAALLLAACGPAGAPATPAPGDSPAVAATPATPSAPAHDTPAALPEQPAPTAVSVTPPATAQGPTSTAPAASTPDSRLRRAVKLTANGCCPAPQWLPDGSGVFFYGDYGDGPGDRSGAPGGCRAAAARRSC